MRGTLAAMLLAPLASLHAVNPLNSGIGPTFTDPHGVVFDGRVYLFTTDDFSPENKGYVMKDWRAWSSSDLVAWKLESTLKPEETFIGKPFNDCWATFGVREFRKGNVYYDRHGNFFTFNNQWYYVCNDLSQPGRTHHYRDSIMAYVHYKDNGEMAPVRIDRFCSG